jgi:hypothetical protein
VVAIFFRKRGNNMIYSDTDSATRGAYTKQILNSMYGVQCGKRDYISVIADDKPMVIFKRNIIAVSKSEHYTQIICVNDITFITKEDYASVVKKIIG